MSFKELVKNTSYLAATKFFQFIAGLIRIKMIAYFLGLIGTGLVDQLTFITQKMSQFTLLSMSEAVVKQIAENKNSAESIKIINSAFKAYILLICFFMLISSICLYAFSESITIYVFGEISYISYFYIGLFSFPILIIDTIPFSILKAFKDVKAIAKARIISVIINLIIVVPLIYFFKLNGAIAFIPLSYSINLIVNFIVANNNYFKELNISFISIFRSQLNRSHIKELLVFSTFGVTVGMFTIVSEFICRSIVVSNLGVESIGYYSPIIMWAGLITGFILPSFSTYLYPKFCELKTNRQISDLLNEGIKLGTFAIIPLLLLGIPYREFFILLLYSEEFVGSSIYLPFHFLGVVFYVWWYIFTQAMTPTGRIKQHGILLTMYLTLDIIITYIFVNQIGLYGWMLKHIVSPIVFFFVYMFYAQKYMNFILSNRNKVLMAYLIFSALLLIFIDSLENGLFINLFLGPILLVLVLLILDKSEKLFLINRLQLKKHNV